MRYAARTDQNQQTIVNHLRHCGASVYVIKLPTDLLVGYGGSTAIVECKNPDTSYGRAGLNKNQRDWLKTWKGGTVAIVDSIEAADKLLKVLQS